MFADPLAYKSCCGCVTHTNISSTLIESQQGLLKNELTADKMQRYDSIRCVFTAIIQTIQTKLLTHLDVHQLSCQNKNFSCLHFYKPLINSNVCCVMLSLHDCCLTISCLEAKGMEGGVQARWPASCCSTSLCFNICKFKATEYFQDELRTISSCLCGQKKPYV